MKSSPTPFCCRARHGHPLLQYAGGLLLALVALAPPPADAGPIQIGTLDHCDDAVASGDFRAMFDCGDELFEKRYTAAEGVGANVGDGGRFTRVPRADLRGPGEWASHVPPRATGPNAASCNACHNQPVDDGGGEVAGNAVRDPLHSGSVRRFIQRNTPSLFGAGALQRLAEEMTSELQRQLAETIEAACNAEDRGLHRLRRDLSAKGIHFGSVEVTARNGRNGCRHRTRIQPIGIDEDLVLKPFQWKGTDRTLRGFNRDASHNEIGMQAVELVGELVDGDGDGIVNEMTVADQTALTLYVAAQPRPVTRLELADLREVLSSRYGARGAALADELELPALDTLQRAAILSGQDLFEEIGCAGCHTPTLTLDDPVFAEPSRHPAYRDETFPSGLDPLAFGLDPDRPHTLDLTTEHPDNVVMLDGEVIARLGDFETDANGRALIRLYSDLKRHDMGPGLAENIDEAGTGASVWLTRPLWGVGSTDQYLHDGRATTLDEAILAHGGEAADARDAFATLNSDDQADLIAFLANLVLLKLE